MKVQALLHLSWCARKGENQSMLMHAKQFPEHFFEEVRVALAILFGRLMRNRSGCSTQQKVPREQAKGTPGRRAGGWLIAKRAKPIHTRARGAASESCTRTHTFALLASAIQY
jgi:hypothetical protein